MSDGVGRTVRVILEKTVELIVERKNRDSEEDRMNGKKIIKKLLFTVTYYIPSYQEPIID